MIKNADDIATLITWECGKPVAEAKGETNYAASFLEWFSEEAPRTYGDTYPCTAPARHSFMVKQPIGVCALITPWNFPAAMVTRKVGAALAAGCTVILKSPGETPFTANAIAELARRAGLAPGVFNIITSLRNTPKIGEALTLSPIVKKVSFTGSTGVGKLLMSQSSSTLKKLSLELGGNAPFVIFEDCHDIDEAIEGCIIAKFRGSGQTCVCANRIYVQSGIYREFASKLTERVKQFKVGPGFNVDVTHGPLISNRAVEKVHRHVQDAVSKGAVATAGGSPLSELGDNFYSPTVLTDMNHTMEVASDETFGPVAGLFEFHTEDEVIELANESTVGLAAYIYSSDIDKVYRVSDELEVGMVGINTGSISDPATPFGGIKESGFGKEVSKYGIEEYTVTKTITVGYHKVASLSAETEGRRGRRRGCDIKL